MPFVPDWVVDVDGEVGVSYLTTPVAHLKLQHKNNVIVDVDWCFQSPSDDSPSVLQMQLNAYWHRPDVNIAIKLLRQGTAYQQTVWQVLTTIPPGQTLTYSELAKRLNSSPRAVGNALRANPYPFFIPCHRIIAKNGLGGYCGELAGDFVDIKQRLLALEAQLHDSY